MIATRRGWLAAAGLAIGAGPRAAAAATPVPEAATLLAPGPEAGPHATLAAGAARGLARGLVRAAALRVQLLGGPDGVTAANRFAASSGAEGRGLLLLPGAAPLAVLAGESRARFDPRAWPAIGGSVVPAVLAGRGPLAEGARLVLPGPTAPEAGALLVLDLLGRPAQPVMLAAGGSAEAAVAAGQADALVLAGSGLALRLAALGLTPWIVLDAPGQPREAGLAGVPGFPEVLADPPRPDLLDAARAAAAGLRARGLLVLPALTAADAVALWRGAAQRWAEEEPEAAEAGARRIGPQEATALLGALCPAAPEAALAYRDWLQRRFGFRGG